MPLGILSRAHWVSLGASWWPLGGLLGTSGGLLGTSWEPLGRPWGALGSPNGPKRLPRDSRSRPRAPKRRPRGAQEASRTPLGVPFGVISCLKHRVKVVRVCLHRFQMFFCSFLLNILLIFGDVFYILAVTINILARSCDVDKTS